MITGHRYQRPVENPDEGSNNHMHTPNPRRPRSLHNQRQHATQEPAGVPTTGTAWARFTIASTPRRYDTNSGSWVDGEPLFLRCTVWRDLAEHAIESLAKGQRVIATGRLRQSSWETPEGDKRTAIGLDVDEIGPSLRWATAKVTRIARTSGGNGEPPPQDPWSGPTVPAARNASTDAPAGVGASAEAPPF
jgi:single-strand DNA-binding protein